MSSIMEKGKLPTKMFLRSNSFQKLCSLAHPMRLRGFKSNKEALKSVFESLIVTTRGVIQSVTYRILCFLFLTPFTKLLSRPLQGIVDAVATSVASAAAAATEANSGKDGNGGDAKNRLNTVRLILKLTLSMIVSTDKTTDVSCDNEPKLSEVSPTEDVDDDESATYKDVLATGGECPPRTTVDTAVQTDDQEPPQEFFDCKEPSPTHRSLESSSSVLRQLQQPRPRRPSRTSPATLVAIYGCILGCVLQLSALVYLLSGDAVRFPPGLIFLILALAYIGYVMTRIFTANSPSRKMAATRKKDDDCGNSAASKAVVALPEGVIRKQSSFCFAKGLHPVLAAVSKRIVATLLQQQQQNHQKSSVAPPRMSRSATRTRMLLCADDKTISKVKIL